LRGHRREVELGRVERGTVSLHFVSPAFEKRANKSRGLGRPPGEICARKRDPVIVAGHLSIQNEKV